MMNKVTETFYKRRPKLAAEFSVTVLKMEQETAMMDYPM